MRTACLLQSLDSALLLANFYYYWPYFRHVGPLLPQAAWRCEFSRAETSFFPADVRWTTQCSFSSNGPSHIYFSFCCQSGGWGWGPCCKISHFQSHCQVSLSSRHCYEYLFFFKLIYFNWRLTTLQYWGGFCHTPTWISHGYTCVTPPLPPPFPPQPSGLSQSTSFLGVLLHALNLHWSSILGMVIYMFQW